MISACFNVITLSVSGISMHKGYAFVQYTNPFDARGACLGEDGRTILGQTLGEYLKHLLAITLKIFLKNEYLIKPI